MGRGEKQGWDGESWATVVQDWVYLSSCHPGEIGVTQHHLEPASPTSVSLAVQSSGINKPLETAVLLPWQGTVLDRCQLCWFLKLVSGMLDLFSDIHFPLLYFTYVRYPVPWEVSHLLLAFSVPLKAHRLNKISSCRPSPTKDPVLWNQMKEMNIKWKFTPKITWNSV